MSLLNEMLKDLRDQKPKMGASVLTPPQKKIWTERLPTLFFWLIFAVMLMLFTYALAFWLKPANLPEHSDTPSLALESELPSIVIPSNTLFADEPYPANENDRENASDEEPVSNDDLVLNKKETHFSQQEWVNEKLNKALEAIEEGSDDRAVDLLSSILIKVPTSVEARENLAALYLSHQEFKSALSILDEGLQRQPYNLPLTMMKSRILFEQGGSRDALALLEKFNPDMNAAPEYYALLAAIFESLGRTDAAGSLYQALVKIDPSNGQYWLGLGLAFEHTNSNQQAIEAYRRASQSDNSQPAVRIYAENRLKTLQG